MRFRVLTLVLAAVVIFTLPHKTTEKAGDDKSPIIDPPVIIDSMIAQAYFAPPALYCLVTFEHEVPGKRGFPRVTLGVGEKWGKNQFSHFLVLEINKNTNTPTEFSVVAKYGDKHLFRKCLGVNIKTNIKELEEAFSVLQSSTRRR